MSKELANRYFLTWVNPLPGLATSPDTLDSITVSRLSSNHPDRDVDQFNQAWASNPISNSPFNSAVWENAVDEAIAKIGAVTSLEFERAENDEIANINYYLVDRLASGGTRAQIAVDETYLGENGSGIDDWGLISFYFDRDENQLKNTVLHEFVHALGASDVFSSFSIPGIVARISSFFSDFVPPVLLDRDENSQKFTVVSNNAYGGSDGHSTELGISDIWAIQQIYGVNTETATGDDNYDLEGRIFQSIWDAGGQDTIDASGVTGNILGSGATIDLRQGHFSSLGRDDNVGIAHGAVIENATGSSADDVILGNATANIITAAMVMIISLGQTVR